VIKRTPSPTEPGTFVVSFSLPLDDAPDETSVVGEFNGWDPARHPMRRRSNGTRSVKIPLGPGAHHFKYLGAGGVWRTDPTADRQETNEWGEVDSVVDL
jgi:1,4-alpha-glucan branching enzyme